MSGFFNEQPQIVAQASSPDVRGLNEAELAKSSGLSPLNLEGALYEASGRTDGISSPMLRDKALQGIGSLGAALEAELLRVAAWRKDIKKGWARPEKPSTAANNNNSNMMTVIADKVEIGNGNAVSSGGVVQRTTSLNSSSNNNGSNSPRFE